MLLKELILKEKNIDHWSVYNHKNEQIAMTSRALLLEICDENKEFKKSVKEFTKKEESSFIRVNLNESRK